MFRRGHQKKGDESLFSPSLVSPSGLSKGALVLIARGGPEYYSRRVAAPAPYMWAWSITEHTHTALAPSARL